MGLRVDGGTDGTGLARSTGPTSPYADHRLRALTGVYPGGEGAVVQVQRFESGKWVDFPVDASVSGETFSTYVQTARTGVNRFRVRDTSGPDVSNEVRVTVH